MSRLTRLLIAALLAFPVLSGGVEAQQIILEGLEEPAEPDRDRSGVPEQPEKPRVMHGKGADDQPAAAIQPTTTMMPLRPMRAQVGSSGHFRLQGQYAKAEFLLFLPRDPGATTFQLKTQSAINVLPDQSSIEVFVNGTSVGRIQPGNFDREGVDELEVPAGLFRAGRNRVSLVARQVHRVFCGPEASFSLWTDITLIDSGVLVPTTDLTPDPLGFLAATGAQLARGEPFSIRISGAEFSLGDAASIIARVEDIFGGTPPKIDFEDYYAVSPTPPQLARVTALPPDQLLPDGPEFHRGGDGAIVLLTNSGKYAEVGRLLFGAMKDTLPSEFTPLLTPGQRTALADIGSPTIEGYGRYFRAPVSFRLPRDWLLLASQEAALELDYQFDHQLPEGSLLLVKINNTTVRLLPLDDAERAGRPLRTLRIPFAANLLQPGVNRLTFESLVPGDPPDQACALRTAPIFQVSGTSALFVPGSPSMTLPGIDAVLGVIGPGSIRMSEAARSSIPLGLLPQLAAVYANDPPPDMAALDRSGYELKVGVAADLSTLSGDVVDGNTAALQSVLLNTIQEKPEEVDPWKSVDGGPWWRAFYDLGEASSLPSRLFDRLVTMWHGPEIDLPTWLAGHAAEAMLIQPDMANPEKTWLFLRSRADPARIIASLAATHQEFEGPHGQVSLYSSENGWVSWNSPNRPLSLNESLTLGNMRAVVGNYVTITPARYIVPLFLLILCSAIVAIGIAILTRRKR
ncbi:cellulose biosynthesis cyclic di-GMP-binding regulatory protein BcsB [Oceaniglobus trochenteri]|uniref:cellulose biosynthesis cyclic di-GMP-binding regulatory protein BcsB n=1 Tax=Oceaniglobus trochenteri TaxID=2763260 RepID=UPI001D0013A4|nr:cellulose biosynthesis cyclic di-GMP-binding regulatory protein BcsB [Oceaniglobus trochenteri]